MNDLCGSFMPFPMKEKTFLKFDGLFQVGNLFRKRDLPADILRYSLDLFQAQLTGLLYGTDESNQMFLPPRQWDRGIVYRLQGRGVSGFFLKIFGPFMVRVRGLSPVHMYCRDGLAGKRKAKGITAYTLRSYVDFYQKGVKVLIVCDILHHLNLNSEDSATIPVISFDGSSFSPMDDLCVNVAIIRQFVPENLIAAYVPDFGVLLIKSTAWELFRRDENGFVHGEELMERLNHLVRFIEDASIAFLARVRGPRAAEILWRKEKALRKAGMELARREDELIRQKACLSAVGGVTEEMLSMEPALIHEGVYAFVDMVGSALIRRAYNPRDYFYMSNCCRRIAAGMVGDYFCRLGNYIGDGIFFQNVSVFDNRIDGYICGLHERVSLMILFIAAFFREIDLLNRGEHVMDAKGRVGSLLREQNRWLQFRAGIETGPATIGPVGDKKRMIVTAIGEGVDHASRLESTGVPDEIHLSPQILDILNRTWISYETEKVYTLLLGSCTSTKDLYFREYEALKKAGRMRFMDLYKLGFHDPSTVLRCQENVSHKEYVRERTYLLKWRKTENKQTTCMGI